MKRQKNESTYYKKWCASSLQEQKFYKYLFFDSNTIFILFPWTNKSGHAGYCVYVNFQKNNVNFQKKNQGITNWNEALLSRSADKGIFKVRVWFIFQDEKINKNFFNCNPDKIYLLKVNTRNTRKRCEICSKLLIKVLVLLLLTLNIFNISFYRFYCWLWTSKCYLGSVLLQQITRVER